MRVSNSALLLLVIYHAGIPAFADDYRQHGAHQHGVGKLNIPQKGSDMHIQLNSPAANIVGFEHSPNSDADHGALDDAMTRLKDGASLFLFPEAAVCRLAEADIATPWLDHDDGEGGHSGHPHHAEEPLYDNDTEDSENYHAHEDHHEHEEGQVHVDITAVYRFTCAAPEALERLTVRLFEAFPATERLQIQFITGTRQGAADLSASQTVLRFWSEMMNGQIHA